MRNKIIFWTSISILLSVVIVAFFVLNKDNPYKNNNNFKRSLVPNFISNFKYIDIKYNSYYIAGISSENIFLGNVTNTRHLLTVNRGLEDTLYSNLQYSGKSDVVWQRARILVDFPDLYLYERVSPRILHGRLPSLQLSENYNLEGFRFDKLVPISPHRFALRHFDTTLRQNILAAQITNSSTQLISNKTALKKQVDGKFCTDGMLLYSAEIARVIYLYYYRNQFLCLDTNMNVVTMSRTIDTVSVAKVKLDTIHSEHKVTFSSPPLVVNRKSCVYKDKLFVYSKLIADNEEAEIFKQNSVIDIYDLSKGGYVLSFYIPDFKKQKASQFMVFENQLVTIYDRYLATFDIDFDRLYKIERQ